jgi:hypothetical protein
MEEGKWKSTEFGTAQGSSASPLLANVFFHYSLDLCVAYFEREAKGEVHYVRYADDFVAGFQYNYEAVKFLESLKERLAKFSLELHPAKTRLIEFGRFGAENRCQRGEKKPETFDFLGLTHICPITQGAGKFRLIRKTIRKHWQMKLKSLYQEIRERINQTCSRSTMDESGSEAKPQGQNEMG